MATRSTCRCARSARFCCLRCAWRLSSARRRRLPVLTPCGRACRCCFLLGNRGNTSVKLTSCRSFLCFVRSPYDVSEECGWTYFAKRDVGRSYRNDDGFLRRSQLPRQPRTGWTPAMDHLTHAGFWQEFISPAWKHSAHGRSRRPEYRLRPWIGQSIPSELQDGGRSHEP